MQGSPSAVSWGPGRMDVFVRGGGNELAHQWYDHGPWSGWDSYANFAGLTITGSPSVISPEPGHLDVYVRATNGALYHKWFSDNNWSYWDFQGGFIADGSPTAAARGPSDLDVFVLGGEGRSLYVKSYKLGWADYRYLTYSYSGDVTAYYWVP
jgi:Repeat of unknown function (DUF346)